MSPEIPTTFAKLQLPPLNKKNQTSIIEVVLLIIIVVLFYWFIVSPKKAELGVLTNKVSDLTQEKNKVNDQKTALQTAIAKIQSDKDSIAKLDESLPFNNKVMALNLIVEKLASDSGVILGNVGFSASGDSVVAGNPEVLKDFFSVKRSLKKITGSFNVKGQYSQVQAFLQKLEDSGRIFDLNDLQISPSQEDGSLQITGSINAYYYGQ